MGHKENIQQLISKMATEVLAFIREEESKYKDRWVPAAHIKNSLALSFVAVPKGNKQYGEKGWLFAIIARILEDENRIEYRKAGSRAFCRSSE